MSARAWIYRRERKTAVRMNHRNGARCKHCASSGEGHRTWCPRVERLRGRLRIEQRARERRALIVKWTHGSRWSPGIARAFARARTYGGICPDRGWGGRLSKHQRGRTARRNRRGA